MYNELYISARTLGKGIVLLELPMTMSTSVVRSMITCESKQDLILDPERYSGYFCGSIFNVMVSNLYI
jgi:hypothetical protein